MMTTVLIVLCLYLATCYAYGGVLLLGVLRRRGANVDLEAPAPAETAPGPRAGIHRASEPGPAQANDATESPVRAAA